jgi:hypothetical protein
MSRVLCVHWLDFLPRNRKSATGCESDRSSQNQKRPRLTPIAFVLVMAASVGEAQQAGTLGRIGYLGAASYVASKSM